MNPNIIVIAVILIVFVIFAKCIYPKIVARRQIDFFAKAKQFLNFIDIPYDNSEIVYAEQNRNYTAAAITFGKQLIFGTAGVQQNFDMIKYIIVYNKEHIIIIPVCVNEFNGNILLCEENDIVIRHINIAEILDTELNQNICTFILKGEKMTFVIPDKTPTYMYQTEFKEKFINCLKNLN